MTNTLWPTLIGAGIIVGIYLFYFLATYFLGKKIIHSDE